MTKMRVGDETCEASSDIVLARDCHAEALRQGDDETGHGEERVRNNLGMYTEEIRDEFLRYAAQRPGDYLQTHLMACQTTVYRKDIKRIISSARPLHALVTLRSIQILLLCSGVLMLFALTSHGSAFLPFSQVGNHEVRRSRFFRLHVHTFRAKHGGKGNTSSSAFVHDFGALQNNCKVKSDRASYEYSQNSIVLRFEREITFDGWYFVTNNLSIEADPIDFRLETSMDGDRWDEVGLPWVCGSKHERDVVRHKDFSFPTPLKRLEDVKFDFSTLSCTYGQYLDIIAMLIEGSMTIVAALVALQDFYGIPIMVCSAIMNTDN